MRFGPQTYDLVLVRSWGSNCEGRVSNCEGREAIGVSVDEVCVFMHSEGLVMNWSLLC
jgi:hypothetical protein